MEIVDHIIEFDKYCKTCKHKELEDKFDPCNECLENCVSTNSSKPVYYEADEKLVKEEEEKENE